MEKINNVSLTIYFQKIYQININYKHIPFNKWILLISFEWIKLYYIPNKLLGLDYVSISKGGTKIIYDETPESLAKNAIRILNNSLLRSKLKIEAKNRNSPQWNHNIKHN